METRWILLLTYRNLDGVNYCKTWNDADGSAVMYASKEDADFKAARLLEGAANQTSNIVKAVPQRLGTVGNKHA